MEGQKEENKAFFLNMQDKFLNTPLLLASIYNYEVRKEDKFEIIKLLL